MTSKGMDFYSHVDYSSQDVLSELSVNTLVTSPRCHPGLVSALSRWPRSPESDQRQRSVIRTPVMSARADADTRPGNQ